VQFLAHSQGYTLFVDVDAQGDLVLATAGGSLSMHGFDPTLSRAVIVHCLAALDNAAGQGGFGHRIPGPKLLRQSILGHYAAMLDKVSEYLKRLGLELDRQACAA
jgi:hypothetical protein